MPRAVVFIFHTRTRRTEIFYASSVLFIFFLHIDLILPRLPSHSILKSFQYANSNFPSPTYCFHRKDNARLSFFYLSLLSFLNVSPFLFISSFIFYPLPYFSIMYRYSLRLSRPFPSYVISFHSIYPFPLFFFSLVSFSALLSLTLLPLIPVYLVS